MTAAAQPQLPKPDYCVLPYRRAQVRLDEPQLRAMFGLAADESIVNARYDTQRGGITVVVESPRLRPVGFLTREADSDEWVYQPVWDTDPPYIKLPISDSYEPQDDKPYPSMVTFPTPGGPAVTVPLTRTDGVLAPNDPDGTIMGLLKDDEQATVRQVCARYSLAQS